MLAVVIVIVLTPCVHTQSTWWWPQTQVNSGEWMDIRL
jgi:hypothetical protein